MKKLIALSLVLVSVLSLFVGCGKTSGEVVLPELNIEETAENRANAQLETGLAFFRKNDYIQYDYTAMSVLGRYFGCRYGWNGENTPEYASPARTLYNTCTPSSYFVNYETFGFELMGGAVEATDIDALPKGENPDGTKIPECIFVHWNSPETLAEDAKVAEEVLGWLQPGDIVSYRRYGDNSGHTLIWAGRDLNGDGTKDLFNADGSYYDTANLVDVLEEDGSVDINTHRAAVGSGMRDSGEYFLFDPASSQYLGGADPLKKPKAVQYYSVVRVVDKAEQYPMTTAAKTRLLYPGMNIYFTLPQGHYGAVTRGEELTYTLTVQNASGGKLYNSQSDYYGQAVNYENILVQIPVPAGTELVSVNGQKVKGGLVKFTMNVAAGDTVSIPITMKATGNVGDVIVMDGAYLHGIKLPIINTVIQSGALDAAQVDAAIKANASASGLEFANAVYTALGKTINLPTDIGDVQDMLFETKRIGDYKIFQPLETIEEAGKTYAQMLVPEFVGGIYYNAGKGGKRVKQLRNQDLQAGDILVWEELKGLVRVAVHNGTSLVWNNDGTLVELDQLALDKFLKYRFFMVLRPTQVY